MGGQLLDLVVKDGQQVDNITIEDRSLGAMMYPFMEYNGNLCVINCDDSETRSAIKLIL